MSPNRKLRLLFLCASTTLAFFSAHALAANRSWINSAGGSFNLATNWSPAQVPGTADSAFFNLGAFTYTVNFAANVTNTQLTIDQNNVTFDLGHDQYQLIGAGNDLATAPIRVGAQPGDNALLRLTNGTLLGNTA